ncbi:MAG: hypothetical protein DMG25_08835 [Acidobacteria bacterium]|nr:MAG: hypothetical protein DMG25_08835 [Acidobacteriota bacterium]PYV21113.1 MAG: hypothetical protein DMG27_21485 [Acidobacteriota bacterium]
MKLRFSAAEIPHWAGKYAYPRPDHYLNGELRAAALQQQYITRDQLLKICRWKAPRAAPKAEPNNETYVRDVTAISFSTQNERLRIEVLTLLDGVKWPTASTILHFAVNADYPILDDRALWSLGIEARPDEYEFDLWNKYVQICRAIAAEARVPVRTLDKALWQYAKIHQPPRGAASKLR